MKRLIALLSLLSLSCCHSGPVMDPSIAAAQAGDVTLAVNACSALPGLGGDICRVTEGQTIAAVWRVVLPTNTQGGELTATYKDVVKSYPVKAGQALLEVPFTDFFEATTWDSGMDGVIDLVGQLNFKNAQGITQLWWARGIAMIVVTKAGYDVLPLDSGFIANKTTCKLVEVQSTTAGRTAIKYTCK